MSETYIRTAIQPTDAEEAVIGCLLKRPESIPRAQAVLRAQDFAVTAYRNLYTILCRMYEGHKDIDLLTVDAECKAAGLDYTSEIASVGLAAITRAQLTGYCEIVKDASRRRFLCRVGQRMADLAEQPGSDLDEIIAGVRESFAQMDKQQVGWVDQTDVLISAYEDIESRSKGKITPCTYGISTLDAVTGGLFPGELTIIGARPSVGKTALAMYIAIASAKAGHKVGFVSAEMAGEQVGLRMLSESSGVNGRRLRTARNLQDTDWDKLAAGIQIAGALPISWLFQRNLEEIVAQSRALVERGACDLLVVDYIQLLTTTKAYREDRLRVAAISATLKALALEVHIPVIALAQLTRPESTAIYPPMPKLSSLKDSGSLEQDADNVILMHRVESTEDKALPSYAYEFAASVQDDPARFVILLNCAKARQGEIGIVPVVFDGSTMTYHPITRR